MRSLGTAAAQLRRVVTGQHPIHRPIPVPHLIGREIPFKEGTRISTAADKSAFRGGTDIAPARLFAQCSAAVAENLKSFGKIVCVPAVNFRPACHAQMGVLFRFDRPGRRRRQRRRWVRGRGNHRNLRRQRCGRHLGRGAGGDRCWRGRGCCRRCNGPGRRRRAYRSWWPGRSRTGGQQNDEYSSGNPKNTTHAHFSFLSCKVFSSFPPGKDGNSSSWPCFPWRMEEFLQSYKGKKSANN